MAFISRFPAAGGGPDISSTTATPADVTSGAVFFMADGTQASGGISDYRSSGYTAMNGYTHDDTTNEQIVVDASEEGSNYYGIAVNSVMIPYSAIALAIGLVDDPSTTTSDKIVSGNTILGIQGTGGGGGGGNKTVTISNTSSLSGYCYVDYDGTHYYTQGDTISIPVGGTLRCYANCGPSNYLFVDGTQVVGGSGALDYNYTVTGNISVEFDISIASYGMIRITTT